MKKLLIMGLFALFFAACSSDDTTKKLLGTWQLTAVSGETLGEAEKSMTLTIKTGGSAISQRSDKGEIPLKWSYKMQNGKKLLIFSSEQGPEENTIKNLNDSILVLQSIENEITFTKK